MSTRTKRMHEEAGTLAGQLLAAMHVIGINPDPTATVRADMREIVERACADPVRAALIGLSILSEYTRDTDRTVAPSEDGKPELKVFGTLIDALTARLDAADARARGDTIH